MLEVNFSEYDFRFRKEGGKEMIFDELRRKWVRLTPEEWVRQHWIRHLTQNASYPSAMIAIEKEISLGMLKKRFDLLVYDSMHRPWMLIECKAMEVVLDETVADQILRYHQQVPALFLMITNGRQNLLWKKSGASMELQSELPGWGAV